MQAGGSAVLSATVEPKDTTQETVWTSSDESVATVLRGRVTGVKAGKATITATAGDQSASCEVTVTAPPKLSSIKLYRSQQDYKDGKDPLEMTPEFSRDQHTYEDVYKRQILLSNRMRQSGKRRMKKGILTGKSILVIRKKNPE